MPKIVTKPYQLARLELSMISAIEYLRIFWWFALIIPSFGLFAVIFGDGILRMVGAMALFWPFTIPGRSFLSSSKASRLFTQPCHMVVEDDCVTFYSERTEPKQLRYVFQAGDVRDVVSRGEVLLLRARRLGFAPIKRAAFKDPSDEQLFLKTVADMVETRLAMEEAKEQLH